MRILNLLKETGATSLLGIELVQELWSGYGQILRVRLENASVDSVVVKHVKEPGHKHHPRDWNTDHGHRRKVKSYNVESTWFQLYSKNSTARLHECLSMETNNDELLLVMGGFGCSWISLA